MMVEDDPALAIGECHEPDPDPVAIRDRLLQIGLADSSSMRRSTASVAQRATSGGIEYCDAVSAKASRTSTRDSAITLLRKARFKGDKRSSLRRRMTGRRVRPLTSKVNNTKPVASTATAFLTSGAIRVFSVTASANAKVTAPRNPPPGDRQLICGADLLAEMERAQERQQSEQYRHARGQRCRNRDQQQPGILKVHAS
jgi:hypothetical protein